MAAFKHAYLLEKNNNNVLPPNCTGVADPYLGECFSTFFKEVG